MPPYIRNTLLNFFSFFLIAFSLYIFISLVSYDATDSGFFNKNSNDVINNLGGPLGALISDLMITLIGFGSYLVLLIGSVWAIQSLFIDDKYNSALKVLVRLAKFIFYNFKLLCSRCFLCIGKFWRSYWSQCINFSIIFDWLYWNFNILDCFNHPSYVFFF